MQNQLSSIADPVIAININQTFRAGMNAQDKYDFTRGIWRLDPVRASRAHYVFTIYQGIVKEVYEIHTWHAAGSTEYLNKRYIDPALKNRFEFVGKVAVNNVRDKYLGKTMPEKHGQNPIKYYNC